MAVNLTYIELYASDIINSLNFATNCTAALAWLNVHNPAQYLNNGSCNVWKNGSVNEVDCQVSGFDYGPYNNTPVNLDFLQTSLPLEYQNNSDVFEILEASMASSWENGFNINAWMIVTEWNWFLNVTWYEHALFQTYSTCVGQELANISLNDLTPLTDCNTSAAFLARFHSSDLDPSVIVYIYPLYSELELAFWRTLLRPLNSRLDLDAVLSSYLRSNPGYNQLFSVRAEESFGFVNGAIMNWIENLFRGPEARNATQFARDIFSVCEKDTCEAFGFTGNPDIGGIGVMISYILETSFVTAFGVWHIVSGIKRGSSTTSEIAPKAENVDTFYDVLSGSATYFLSGLWFGTIFLLRNHSSSSGSTYQSYLSNMVIMVTFLSLCVLRMMDPKEKPTSKNRSCSGTIVFIISSLATISIVLAQAFVSQDSQLDSKCLQLQLAQGGPPGGLYRWEAVGVAIFAVFLTLMVPSKFLISMGIIAIWLHVYLLINLRRAMQSVAGGTWSEATWGFGQAVALLTWFPPLVTISKSAIEWFPESNATEAE